MKKVVPIITKDCMEEILNVGDRVLYQDTKYKRLWAGTIHSIGKKMITIIPIGEENMIEDANALSNALSKYKWWMERRDASGVFKIDEATFAKKKA